MATKTFLKSSWFTDTIPFLFVWGLDRLTKIWAIGLDTPLSFPPLMIETIFNHGIILGTFSNLPPVLRLVTLASVGAFLLCVYVFLRTLVPIQSSTLKIGLSMFVAGIAGNVADRMIGNGGVVDFLSFILPSGRTPVFNIADVFQVFSYAVITSGLFREARNWRRTELRSLTFISKHSEIRFSLYFLGAGMFVGVVTSVMSYTFLKVILEQVGNPEEGENYLETFVIAVCVTLMCSSLVLFLIGGHLSHKVSGPLFALRRFMVLTLLGKRFDFRLREDDPFKEFEDLASELNARLNGLRVVEKSDESSEDSETDKAA